MTVTSAGLRGSERQRGTASSLAALLPRRVDYDGLSTSWRADVVSGLTVGVVALVVVVGLAFFRVGPPPAIRIEPSLPGIGKRTSITVSVEEPARGLGGVKVELIQGAARPVGKRAALGRQRHMPRGPVHQRDAHLPLELADMRADGGLRQTQPLGGPPETLRFRETNKG